MIRKQCGCTSTSCGCCEGIQQLTPVRIYNRPGLTTIQERVGTHGEFLETMKARLATMRVDAPGADGQTLETFQPLQGLTTRNSTDPAIALLDGWAIVADVLTFYQERMANEGYLRTATERCSLVELSRLVGYTPRPGVAATVFFAYTMEDKQVDPVEIPTGSRAQSIPGPGELPQSFETSESLIARAAWNNLPVRLTKPQKITLENALSITTIYVAGINVNLKTGDLLLLTFGDNGPPAVVRTVASTEGQFPANRTAVHLQPVPLLVQTLLPALVTFLTEAQKKLTAASPGAARRMVARADTLVTEVYLGLPATPATWPEALTSSADGDPGPEINTLWTAFAARVDSVVQNPPVPGAGNVLTDPATFTPALLKPPIAQAANSLQLRRNLRTSFAPGQDANPQLLVSFAPQLQETFYTAWSSANVNAATPALMGVYALRASASLFGASVPRMATYNANSQLNTPDQWQEWTLSADESTSSLFLDQVNESILPVTFVMIQNPRATGPRRIVRQVAGAQTTARTAYGISGKSTLLTLHQAWLDDDDRSMATLRATFVYGQSEPLTLSEEPISTIMDGQEIELAGLFNELTAGRWIILSGERADIPGVTGVKVSELMMVSGLHHDYDPQLPGDKTHTTLLLATPMAYKYKRDTLAIYANVVKATHGETRKETLGNGDGSQALQTFDLKQPPLTFVPAPTPAGVESTLQVYVNDVAWHEVDTLAGLGPKDRNFVTKTSDDARTSVIFGNGVSGSRLPTGLVNVQATYRQGIGKPGNVLAEQISLLQSRPLGVQSVINPLRASGGADAEPRDVLRENVPLAVMALDRLVSLQDYADFTRTFAGIAKADVRSFSDGRRELMHITIAGADDIPIDPTSDLYRNLLAALRRYGDPGLPIRADRRELVMLVLSAKIRLAADYQWEPVVQQVRDSLLGAFGFQRRALGQPALLCEVIGVIQAVPGVAYVDVDSFGGVPERTAEADGTRRLLTLDEISQTVHAIVEPGSTQKLSQTSGPAQAVSVNVAGFAQGAIHPAQLAILTPTVPATLVLNQIK